MQGGHEQKPTSSGCHPEGPAGGYSRGLLPASAAAPTRECDRAFPSQGASQDTGELRRGALWNAPSGEPNAVPAAPDELQLWRCSHLLRWREEGCSSPLLCAAFSFLWVQMGQNKKCWGRVISILQRPGTHGAEWNHSRRGGMGAPVVHFCVCMWWVKGTDSLSPACTLTVHVHRAALSSCRSQP